MNATLNINRIWLLLQRYFIENKQRELSFWGIAIVVFMLAHQAEAVTIYLFISGLIFAGNTFKSFNYTPSGMHYLLIPATHTEKLITNILLSTFYYFAMFVITYTVGTFLGINIRNLIWGSTLPVEFDLFNTYWHNSGNISFWNMFYSFAVLQSIFMLGSVYFKRNAVFKTILSYFVLIFVLFVIQLFILKVGYGSFHIDNHDINIQFMSFNEYFPGFETGFKVLGYLSLPFFWLVTYFRLTEKEV